MAPERSKLAVRSLAVVVLLAFFRCAWGWVENTWAASYKTPFTATYHRRAEAFLTGMLISLGAGLLLAAWGTIRWMIRK